MSTSIIDSNALCSIGRGGDQIWASTRARIARITDSGVLDRYLDPIQMGLVAEDNLPPLPPEIAALPFPPRARRMLRLAAPVLASVAASAGAGPVRLVLAVPRIDVAKHPWIANFAVHLAKFAGVEIDLAHSQVIPAGRAGGLIALELALKALAVDATRPMVVGGVDTFLDLDILARLAAEKRILGQHVMDGFIPGEAAAFYVVSGSEIGSPVKGGRPVMVRGAASVRDPGHRYGTEPARGEGLAQAIESLRGKIGELSQPVASTFAALNGESFDSKLWGVAALRHREFFSPDMQVRHPADSCGDTGAAAGCLLTVLASTALARGSTAGHALVWAASDHEPRACALLGS